MDLTIVIPAFNSSATITRAIESAFASGASTVIVVDDGSTDDSANRAEASGALVIRQENSGAAAARRVGLRHVQTESVIVLDADDVLIPAGVSKAAVELAAADSSVGAIVGRFQEFTSLGEGAPSRPWSEGVGIESLFKRGHSPSPPAAILWRTSSLKQAYIGEPTGLWPRYAEDYELVLRAALRFRLLTSEAVVCSYSRVGGKSSLHPERSIAAAHEIRSHYSSVTGIRVPGLTSARRTSLTLRKRSSLYAMSHQKPLRYVLLVLAALLDPHYLRLSLRKVLHRIPARSSSTPK